MCFTGGGGVVCGEQPGVGGGGGGGGGPPIDKRGPFYSHFTCVNTDPRGEAAICWGAAPRESAGIRVKWN